ncbi:MAG TPA: TetR/AcrR family transcriptional regulator [Solirubrobacteraceae bacterium]|jgi:AcrR family transcriptional regulator|nr:TetR/AcrR family transcriptional regulator [Solirubrobacteraceae bacterium]
MVAATSDLTGLARIRNAALEGFARDGVAGTSLRDVAKVAGVSPGLVQHHFATKAALVEAVGAHVVGLAMQAFGDLPASGTPVEAQQQLGDRVTAFVAEQPTALLYVARALAEGDRAAAAVFDAFVEIAEELWQTLADHGLLRDDADITWAALHGVTLILGTVLYQAQIGRHLPESFMTGDQLQRWNAAGNTLFSEGLYRRPPRRSRT